MIPHKHALLLSDKAVTSISINFMPQPTASIRSFTRRRTTYHLPPNRGFFLSPKQGLGQGFGLLEIIIAVAIISSSLFALAEVSVLAVRITQATLERQQAIFLAEEGVENARFARDTSWATLLASSGTQTINNFTRTTTLEDVYRRNSDDDIVPTSSPDLKTPDPNTKKVTVTVSWQTQKGTANTTLSAYLTNLFEL